MTQEEAKRERDRLAGLRPNATWLIAEQKPGEWSVVKVGLEPADPARQETVESHSQPNPAEDPRSAVRKNVGPEYV